MKVNNVSIFMGEDTQSGRRQLLGLSQEQGNTASFFAGSLNNNIDPIAQKKQQAQKQALKVVSDAFAADRKLDTEVALREAKIKELRAENLEAKRALNDLEIQKQEIGKVYGLGEEGLSDEDWKILNAGSEDPDKLTDEEKVRFQELKDQGLMEYYGRCKDIDDLAAPYKQIIDDNTNEIRSYSAANKAVQNSRLDLRKGNPMVLAQEEAEAIMDAAREEVIGMIKDEGMDHVDEEMQDKVEQAQENKEKKEEEEEKLEAIREEKAQIQSRAEAAREKAKQNEERAEELLDALPAEEMILMKDGRADFQQELKDIMNRMKLMAEDLKGAAVDATL
mgnify:CR=1 FL=1